MLTVVGVLALGGVAEGKRVASSVDAGSYPFAPSHAFLEDVRHSPSFEVKASPGSPVEVHIAISCSRGTRSKSRDRDLPAQMAPMRRRIKPTLRNADYCSVDVSASYADFEQSGRIAVAIFY